MPAALDTNVLLPIVRGQANAPTLFLERFLPNPGLIISGPVYAELAAAPGMHSDLLDRALTTSGIAVDLEMTRDLWLGAAHAYRAYAERRLAAGEAWPRRILADFLIGAHAEGRADLLITYDTRDFGRMFPDLDLLVPSP